MSTALAIMETCWGDLGLVLSLPRQGLGNSAIAAVANDEQLARYKGAWASMAITEPDARQRLGGHPHHGRQRRRRLRAERREDLRDGRPAQRPRGRVGDASTRTSAGRPSSRSW